MQFEDSGIFKMSMGDRELFRSNLLLFISETTFDLKDLSTLLQKKNVSAIGSMMHKLAGRTGLMGTKSLSAKLHQKEKELSENKPLKELEIQALIEEIALLVKQTADYCERMA